MLTNTGPGRTVAVTYRSRSRFRRAKLRHPQPAGPWIARLAKRADQLEQPAYDAALAFELLANTCELPSSERGLLITLSHYRHALHALATQLAAIESTTLSSKPQRPADPGE